MVNALLWSAGHIGRLEADTKYQQREVERHQEIIEQQRKQIDQLNRDLNEIKSKQK